MASSRGWLVKPREKRWIFAWFDSRLRPSERQGGPRKGQLCARRAQQRRRDDVLPALRRRFELAVAAHEIGKSLHAVDRAAELVLDLAQHRFDEGGAERHRRLMGQVDLRGAARIAADDARGV